LAVMLFKPRTDEMLYVLTQVVQLSVCCRHCRRTPKSTPI